MQAIKYARGHLAPWATVYLQDLQVTKQVQNSVPAALALCMSDITSPVTVAILVPHAQMSKCSVIIFLQEHQDVLPLNKHRATGVLIAVTLLCCQVMSLNACSVPWLS